MCQHYNQTEGGCSLLRLLSDMSANTGSASDPKALLAPPLLHQELCQELLLVTSFFHAPTLQAEWAVGTEGLVLRMSTLGLSTWLCDQDLWMGPV